jgi:hypothetical protein
MLPAGKRCVLELESSEREFSATSWPRSQSRPLASVGFYCNAQEKLCNGAVAGCKVHRCWVAAASIIAHARQGKLLDGSFGGIFALLSADMNVLGPPLSENINEWK